MSWWGSRFLVAATLLSLSLPACAEQATDLVAPEAATGFAAKPPVTTKKWMVVAANPHAAKAGDAILAKGGNAIDAMVAVQLVLGLVEPQSSGLGGGAFAVYFDAATNKLTTFDGRETAPMQATPQLFLDGDGKPLKFFDAVIGGRSVGTPGTVALIEAMHKAHGKLPWASLFEPAIQLASDGFAVSPRLNSLISDSAESLFANEATRRYFFSEEGVPIFAGTILKNPEYAATLSAIAKDGAKAFYSGDIARDVVDTVHGAAGNPGLLSLDDLAGYKVVEREPVCVNYRQHDVCGMGPPSSGALSVGQILKMAEAYDLTALGPQSAESWRIIGDASRLAFADRGLYMADSDYVKMPKGLVNGDYLKDRAKLLAGPKALSREQVIPGEPPFDHALNYAPDEAIEFPSTSHFSIADGDGNVLSMTTTIENGFGSRLMVRGFLLNNELTDFSFVPEEDGRPVANRVEPGKRPRSSMAPTIVFKDGKPVMAVGSPGGSRIIGYVAKTIIAHLDWGMDAQQSVSLPHLINRFGTYDVEEGSAAEALAPALTDMGYKVEAKELNSGLHMIVIQDNSLEGGADPRREGLAIGQ
ncbi:MAG: gamma-glutamyltransferase [Nitratireductor sp.]